MTSERWHRQQSASYQKKQTVAQGHLVTGLIGATYADCLCHSILTNIKTWLQWRHRFRSGCDPKSQRSAQQRKNGSPFCDTFCQSKEVKRCHIISIAFIINFGILPTYIIYASGSHSHAASGKIFFPIASADGQGLNPDKNGRRMTSHASLIKCFINLPTTS